MKGVIVTCSGMEKLCVTDAYRLFNEVCAFHKVPHLSTSGCSMLTNFTDLKNKVCANNSLQPGVIKVMPIGAAASSTDLDFDDAVSQELKELKAKPAHRRFQSVESGAKNVVFIQCEAPVCPDELVHYMLTHIKARATPCTRYIQHK